MSFRDKATAAMVLLFVCLLPLLLTSCAKVYDIYTWNERTKHCTAAAEATVLEVKTRREIGEEASYLAVLNYIYKGEEFKVTYPRSYADEDEFEIGDICQIRVDPENPRTVRMEADARFSMKNVLSFLRYFLCFVPLLLIVWIRKSSLFRTVEVKESSDAEFVGLPGGTVSESINSARLTTTQRVLYVGIPGKGEIKADNPELRKLAEVLYAAAETFPRDERIAENADQPVPLLDLFYRSEFRSEWLLALRLPETYNKAAAENTVSYAAKRLGIECGRPEVMYYSDGLNAQMTYWGGDKERIGAEAELDEMIYRKDCTIDYNNKRMRHEIWYSDPRKSEVEPEIRAIIIPVRRNGDTP